MYEQAMNHKRPHPNRFRAYQAQKIIFGVPAIGSMVCLRAVRTTSLLIGIHT
jgi:hypothetical protein